MSSPIEEHPSRRSFNIALRDKYWGLISPLFIMQMKQYEVTFRLPTTGTKYHKTIVEAENQVFANKIFEAQYPSANRCGNARPL